MAERVANLCCNHDTCQRLVKEAVAEVWQQAHDEYCDWGEDCPEHTNPHRQPAKEPR